MDTLKITISKDTIVSTNNKTIEKTFVETLKQNNCKDCFQNICDCKILSELIWPLTFLIIIFLFYKKLKSLLSGICERIIKGDDLKIGTSGIELNRPTELKKSEVIVKAENKFETLKEEESQIKQNKVIDKNEFVPKYLKLERQFFEILMKYFYPQFRVLSNRRLDVFEYDIIMETNVSNEMDYIFEVKYFPNGYNKSILQDSILRLCLSTKHYINKTNREAKPLIVIVVQRGDFNLQQHEELNTFTSKTLKGFNKISMLTIFFDEFESLSKENILELMHREV